MSQSIRIQVQLKSFADVKVQGSVTVQDEMSQSIAVAPSGDVSQIEVPVPAQPRFLGLTAQGSDHSGPFFPRRVVLELRPGPTVNHLARTGTLDPEPPITLAPMSSAEGITVRVEVFLPRLREKNLPGFTGTEGVSGTFVNPSSVDHPPPSSWNLIPAAPTGLKVVKLLLEAPPNIVPAWYAIAFVEGQTDFEDLVVFFAPQPPLSQRAAWDAAGYPDPYAGHVKQYVTRSPDPLARSAHKQLAFQVAQSGKKALFVYPVIKFYSPQLGLLEKAPIALFREIVHYVHTRFHGTVTIPLLGFSRIATASFSLGASNMSAFLRAAPGDLRSAIREVYDFDSDFLVDRTVPGNLVAAVGSMDGVIFRRYVHQTNVPFNSREWTRLLAARTYPLPRARWNGVPAVFPTLDPHQDIANHMLTHALARSSFS